MRFLFMIIYFFKYFLCFQYFVDNTVNFSKGNGSLAYPFRLLDDVLSYYISFSNSSESMFQIIILSNPFNYSINVLFSVIKPLKISFIDPKHKVGIIFSSGKFEIEENGFRKIIKNN